MHVCLLLRRPHRKITLIRILFPYAFTIFAKFSTQQLSPDIKIVARWKKLGSNDEVIAETDAYFEGLEKCQQLFPNMKKMARRKTLGSNYKVIVETKAYFERLGNRIS